MDQLIQDLRYSLRRLRHAPGFALVAVATLALGIGANTAIFSFVNGLLFKPPGAVAQPEQLVRVFTADYSSSTYAASSWPDFEDFRSQRSVFQELSALVTVPVVMARPNQLERLNAEIVTPGYFTMLGVQPAIGLGQ